MFWLALDEAWKVRGALLMIVALTAVLGLQGIYQVTHGVGWAGQEMYWGGRIKWVGLWDGANVLSLLFVTAIPTVMELVFGHAALVARLFALASGVLIFEGLYYAASRGAWLALAVVVLAYFRKRLGRAGLLVGSAFVAVLFVIGPSRLATIAGVEEGSADQKSAEHRIDMWAAGIDMVKEHPLLGVGKGKFRRYSMSLIAHNSFVQNMGETGLIGLFFWLAPVYFSIKGLRYVLAAGDASGPLHHSTARTVFVSLVGYLAVGTFITADFEPFFILMALSACMVAITRGPDGRPLRIPVTWRDGACILAIQAAGVIAVHLAVRLNSA
jgi:O-antigen ligase